MSKDPDCLEENMRKHVLFSIVAVLVTTGVALGQSVTFTLESSKAGQTVAASTPIDWTIKISVSTGDNLGLALVECDLAQDPNNPAKFDIPPADPNNSGATMQHFSRPAGICNPGETYPTSGYTGLQRGALNAMNLLQIGGAQNTLGQPGASMGQDVNVIAGVGQSGPQIVAAGVFLAPATSGTYVFRLANKLASTLNSVNAPPTFSPVSIATVVPTTGPEISFTVGQSVCHGDLDCDGTIGFGDINPFVLYLSNYTTWQATYTCSAQNGDINGDGSYPSFDDINPFVSLLSQQPPPACP
jgi:hypothetical protein